MTLKRKAFASLLHMQAERERYKNRTASPLKRVSYRGTTSRYSDNDS